ncbi:hypothetical protein GOP47_0013963 [Adiantum capillus-veneris]|uniref:Uncharacterized protein n=1 Tax=Adiantum capillus-veneris TaxID=13818 RepID=A0A9D4UQH5_ADICA|nr:hypothetical protein GOP47_0013963 [Adiantum capillus-veneris]
MIKPKKFTKIREPCSPPSATRDNVSGSANLGIKEPELSIGCQKGKTSKIWLVAAAGSIRDSRKKEEQHLGGEVYGQAYNRDNESRHQEQRIRQHSRDRCAGLGSVAQMRTLHSFFGEKKEFQSYSDAVKCTKKRGNKAGFAKGLGIGLLAADFEYNQGKQLGQHAKVRYIRYM